MANKLKIAFLISGYARNYIYTTFSFKKHIFNKCRDADIFISFKENSREHYSREDIEKQIRREYEIPIDDLIKDSVYLNYMFGNKLKYFDYDNEEHIQLLISNKIATIDESIRHKISLGTLDQYARVKNIAEIFDTYTEQNGIKYDIVVRLRLDKLWWVTDIDLESYIIDKNKLYFSYIQWEKSPHNGLPNWIQDFIFMGERNLMIYIMKDFFDKIYTSPEFTDKREHNYAPEVQLGKYINSNMEIKDQIIVSNIRFKLYSLYVSRPLYLIGYFVGGEKDVYANLRTLIKTNCK